MIKLRSFAQMPRSFMGAGRFFGCVSGVLVPVLIGCSGTDTTGAPGIQTMNPYTRLQLNVRAAVMSTVAPYDTLQLIPTAYDANGSVMLLPGPVRYTSNDTTIKVNANGLVTLTHASGTSATVIASVQDTANRLTHADTVFILGTTTTPASPLTSFSIHPVGTDSAVLDLGNGTKTLTVTALDANGKAIPATSLKVHYTSENVTLATIVATSGAITSNAPGTLWLTASTTYYGVTKMDSVNFRIGYMDSVTTQPQATVLPDRTFRYSWTLSNIVTGVGKTIVFAIPYLQYNKTAKLLYAGTNLPAGDRTLNEGVQVVFDDSSVAQTSPLSSTWLTGLFASNGSGNINLQIPDSVVVVDSVLSTGQIGQYSVKFTKYCSTTPFPCATARSFSTPGTYHFTSPNTGASGTITVVSQ